MLCLLCMSIDLCNENQPDALFFVSLFHQSTSTCFRHICSPSSGGMLYMYNNWYVLYFLVDRHSTNKHNTYQLLYIYSIPPDDGLQICPKHVEVDWRNKLTKNSASTWFSLHETDYTIQGIQFSANQEIWPQDAVYHLVSAVYCNLTTFA